MASIWGMRKVASGGLEACHSGIFLLPLAPDFVGPDQHMPRDEVFLSPLFPSLSPILQPPTPRESPIYTLLIYLCADLSEFSRGPC